MTQQYGLQQEIQQQRGRQLAKTRNQTARSRAGLTRSNSVNGLNATRRKKSRVHRFNTHTNQFEKQTKKMEVEEQKRNKTEKKGRG